MKAAIIFTVSFFALWLVLDPSCVAQGVPIVIAWQAPVGPDAIFGWNPAQCGTTGNPPCLNCPTAPPSAQPPTEFNCFLAEVLPHVSGIGFVIPWGEIDNCGSAPCLPDNSCIAGTSCYNWKWIDIALADFIQSHQIGPSGNLNWNNGCAGGRPCKIVLIVWLTQDSGNTNLFNGVPNTPAYVFAANNYSTWCSGCAAQDVVVCQDWTGTNSGPAGGWIQAAPISDSCWPSSGSGEYGLWNYNVAVPLHTGTGCTMTVSSNNHFQNYSGYPVMYEKPIMTAAEDFIGALALHYSSACTYGSCTTTWGTSNSIKSSTIAQSIAYMRIGPSSGGENYPYCSSSTATTGTTSCPVAGAYWSGPQGYAAQAQCFSDQGYLTSWPTGDGAGYVSKLYKYISQQNWAFPITTPSHTGPPNNTSLAYADTEAFLANEYGLGIGMQAASIGDLITNAAQYSPTTTANWAVHARQFPKTPVHHLQSMNPGSPTQAAEFSIVSISSAGVISCGSGPANDCSVFCTAPPWVFISGTSNPAFNGIWEVKTSQTGCFGAGSNSIQLVGTIPTGGSSSGFVYSGAHLPVLLPFESQNCQGAIQTICSAELWEESLDWAYGTVTTPGTIGNTGTGDTTYQNAIGNFLTGLPSVTSSHNHMSTSHSTQY